MSTTAAELISRGARSAECVPVFSIPWQIFGSGLTVEPLLAGAQEPLEVTTLPTSTRPTLTHVLAGTGSSIRTRCVHHESAADGPQQESHRFLDGIEAADGRCELRFDHRGRGSSAVDGRVKTPVEFSGSPR